MTRAELLVFTSVIVVSVTALGIPFIRAWRGTWRSWAVQGPGPLIYTKRNYAPLHFGVGALAILALGVAVYVSVERLAFTDQLWNYFLAVFVPVGLIIPWRWPRVLTPRWHKEWVRRGGLPETPLWGPDEEVPQAQARKGWR